ncbi:MAG: hypothetical protein WCO48_01005 [Candidatus Taylorbacteria bacterium]
MTESFTQEGGISREAFFVQEFTDTKSFDKLYEIIETIKKIDPNFCPDKMLNYIKDLEKEENPRIADVVSVFTPITDKFKLRTNVIRLVSEMPELSVSRQGAIDAASENPDNGDKDIIDGNTPTSRTPTTKA